MEYFNDNDLSFDLALFLRKYTGAKQVVHSKPGHTELKVGDKRVNSLNHLHLENGETVVIDYVSSNQRTLDSYILISEGESHKIGKVLAVEERGKKKTCY